MATKNERCLRCWQVSWQKPKVGGGQDVRGGSEGECDLKQGGQEALTETTTVGCTALETLKQLP